MKRGRTKPSVKLFYRGKAVRGGASGRSGGACEGIEQLPELLPEGGVDGSGRRKERRDRSTPPVSEDPQDTERIARIAAGYGIEMPLPGHSYNEQERITG